MRLEAGCQKDFDFEKTLGSGLFYFFYSPEPERKLLWKGENISLNFSQDGDSIVTDIDRKIADPDALKKRISFCLGLKEDLSDFCRLCGNDIVLMRYLEKIRGTRMVSAPTDFEAMLGAVLSQNTSYRSYLRNMKAVHDETVFCPDTLKEKIDCFRFGYKRDYILNLISDFGKREHMEIKGIGRYSVNLFTLFQKRDYTFFYWDCLAEKIMRNEYGLKNITERESHTEAERLWGGWRGLAEAYLQKFYESR